MGDQQSAIVSFDADIRPLFRESDRLALLSLVDLWSYDDVVRHGAQIAERMAEGSLPCDRPFPDVTVSLFDRWLAEGAAR